MSEQRLIVTVPSERLRDDLGSLPEGVDVVVWDADSPAPAARLDLVVLPYMGAKRLTALEGVEVTLVQSQSIGYEGIADRLPGGLRFANAATVHETATAELAVALTLAAQRGLDRIIREGDASRWTRFFATGLADQRVLLLGFGGVGKAIARRLAPFEVALTAVATRARTDDGVEVHALDDLLRLLPTTDILIASLPGGDETRHTIDDAVLSALPDGALVVNVGRGPAVDTDALVDHLRRGRLRAALDVVDPEPLPAEHPLWTLPGAIIAPHVGGASDAMHPRVARLVRRQIDHLLAGEDVENVVFES